MPYVDVENGRRWVGAAGPSADEIRAELGRNNQDLNAQTWGESGTDTASIEEGPNGPHIVTRPRSGGGGDTPSMAALPTPAGVPGGGGGAGDGETPAAEPSMSALMQADPEPPMGFDSAGVGSLRQGIGVRQPPSLAALLTGRRPY